MYIKHNNIWKGTNDIQAKLNGTWTEAKVVYAKDNVNWKESWFREPQLALSFDGVDDYVDCTNNSIVNNLSNLTVEAWVYIDNLTDSYQRLFSQEHVLFVGLDQSKFSFWTGDGSVWHENFSLGSPPEGTWFHVAYVKNGTAGEIFLNSVTIGTGFIYETLGTSAVNNFIGKISLTSDLQHWNGDISDLRIWNTARTQSEIQNNMNRRLKGNEGGLITYYKLNEGSGSTAFDSVGNNDGTINGATWI